MNIVSDSKGRSAKGTPESEITENEIAESCYRLSQVEKEQSLLAQFQALSIQHYQTCKEYRSIVDAYGGLKAYERVSDFPFLAVRLFKYLDLKSVAQDQVFKVLTSSGTTSELRSRIYLDKETAAKQSKALVKILQQFIGKQRLPMMMVDHAELTASPSSFSARAAGVQGISLFGRDTTYLLDPEMNLDIDRFLKFCQQYEGQTVLIFGFTFMVWQNLLQYLEHNDIRVSLPKGILIHSGGWKKLQQIAVDNDSFKARVKDRLGIAKVHNFYGMVEQTGSIFMECEQGVLHVSDFGDVIIRDASNWRECEPNEQGVIQVLSTLPNSYPGHNILTEDLGTLLGVDDCPCGRLGKYFRVDGRVSQAELRGCSDVKSDVNSTLSSTEGDLS